MVVIFAATLGVFRVSTASSRFTTTTSGIFSFALIVIVTAKNLKGYGVSGRCGVGIECLAYRVGVNGRKGRQATWNDRVGQKDVVEGLLRHATFRNG